MDEEILRLASVRARLSVGELEISLRDELKAIEREMSSRGTLLSGMTISRLASAASQSIRERGIHVWAAFRETLSVANIHASDLDAKQLKAATEPYLAQACASAKADIAARAQRYGLQAPFNSIAHEIDSAYRKAVQTIQSEIDLFVLAAQRSPANVVAPSSVHIHGSVGAVQTGTGSTAIVTQHISSDSRREIEQALLGIESGVKASPEVQRVDEVLELVDDGCKEIQKEQPNLTKLGGIASAIGGSIQSIASLDPAYQTLKKAVEVIGVFLR